MVPGCFYRFILSLRYMAGTVSEDPKLNPVVVICLDFQAGSVHSVKQR